MRRIKIQSSFVYILRNENSRCRWQGGGVGLTGHSFTYYFLYIIYRLNLINLMDRGKWALLPWPPLGSGPGH